MFEARRCALEVGRGLAAVPKFWLVFAIHVYRWTISPAQTFVFGSAGGCRFTPTCSQYAVEAVQAHGSLAGTVLAAKRICRCHPWGGCGHDPVPPAEIEIRHSKPGIFGFDR
jgi:putative membrane protein insertion efficiency factor